MTPESRAALSAPTTALKRLTVAWLLFAPVVTLVLSVYFPDAVHTFNTVTSLFGMYYTTASFERDALERTVHQENQEIRSVAEELCDAGLYTCWWDLLNMIEEDSTLMPATADKKTALLHMRKAQQAYAGMLREMHKSRFKSTKSTKPDVSLTV
ncbi:hypothetical protein PG994_005052 [Apiospora phragmitis]|uniref:Uncharacterized protein n=1 Tax=Apiospora phragmitis TaxID=2905665 RepID=A0ABR1VSD5_9PEZI